MPRDPAASKLADDGFLERAYCNALTYELTQRGLQVACEVAVDVFYKGHRVGHYRDHVVGGRVVLEVKATRALDDSHWRQLLNVLRGTRPELGLLLHFGPKPNFERLVFDNRRKQSLPADTPPRTNNSRDDGSDVR